MTTVVLFHSVLGNRPGMKQAAALLREAGHTVHLIDQYDGIIFDDYTPAIEYAEQELGMEKLMTSALELTAGIAGPFVTGGFSNGAGMAQWVACQRPDDVTGVLMFSGALPMRYLGSPWPAGVPGQVHVTDADPWRQPDAVEELVADAEAAGASVKVFSYTGAGHLFADESMQAEWQPIEAELLWKRVLKFLARLG